MWADWCDKISLECPDYYSNINYYSVIIKKLSSKDGGGYIAEVPELAGCIADGKTQKQALKAIKKSIKMWIDVQKEDREIIPKPDIYKTSIL